MIFRDQHERSLLPKGFVAVALLTSIFISASLMFSREVEIFGLQAYKTNGDLMRRILILACFIIYFLRLLMTLFVFFRRKMYWIEAIIIANLLPWIFPYVAYIMLFFQP